MKVAIVTGGTRGIGRAISMKLLSKGYKVYCFYEKNSIAAEEISHTFKGIIPIKVNIRNKNEVSDVVEKIMSNEKNISVLINNAGVCLDGMFMMLSENKWRSVIDTNLTGTFNVTSVVSKYMTESYNACILNVSSISSKLNPIGQCNYSASKAGIEALTKVLSKELSIYGIRVNSVSPGFIKTEMTSEYVKDEHIISDIPLKRFGLPEEVANLAYYLISEKASYITGQDFIIDGGLSC